MKKFLLLSLFVFFITATLIAQIFYTETFDGIPCAAGSGCDPSFISWTTTSTGINGINANKFYVSCQENGNTAGTCGSGCGADQSLHVGNVATSSAAFLFCPTGDCGAAYDDSSPNEATDIRCESPTINCTGQSGISITFNYIENGEGFNDDASLWYFDGTIWNNVNSLAKTSSCGGGQGLWTAFSGTLPPSADNNPNVKIGFRWVNNGDGIASDPSFAVDDINLISSVPTPIELLYFKGKKLTSNSNLLEWVTTSEITNDFFSIERSYDAQSFEKIGEIKGAGNSNNLIYYSFIDDFAQNEINYYRLKQTDFDGSYSYGNIIAIKSNPSKPKIYFYQNQLKIITNITTIKIQITDLSGRIVYSNSSNQKDIDLSFLSKGIYIYQIEMKDYILSDKIILN